MELYLNVAVIAFWLLYSLLIKLTKKRKYDYSGIIAFVFLLSTAYIIYFDYLIEDWYTLYVYGIVGVFILWIIIDNLVLLLGRNISGDEFKKIKDELSEVNNKAEELRQRFISTIELSFEGIIFREEEQIFCTDKALLYLGKTENIITISEHENMLHKDDLFEYKKQLEKLTKRHPSTIIKYRVKKANNYVWIEEKIKLIILDKTKSYISTIKPMDIRMYPVTDVDVLNSVLDGKKMREEMKRLFRTNIPYHFVIISLTNIPIINEKFGRDFGDLMIGEYLSKLRFKFIKDPNSLYRISGIKFGLIVRDKNKFDIMKRALVGQGELFSMNMKFGGVNQILIPNIGISESPYGGKNSELVIQEAEKALALTLKDNYEKTYSFYKD